MECTALVETVEGHVPTTAESLGGLTKDGYEFLVFLTVSVFPWEGLSGSNLFMTYRSNSNFLRRRCVPGSTLTRAHSSSQGGSFKSSYLLSVNCAPV